MERASLTWVVRSSYLAAAASRAVLACSPSFWGMPVSYAFSCTTLSCNEAHQNAVLTIAKSMHMPLSQCSTEQQHCMGISQQLQKWCGGVVYRCRGGAEK